MAKCLGVGNISVLTMVPLSRLNIHKQEKYSWKALLLFQVFAIVKFLYAVFVHWKFSILFFFFSSTLAMRKWKITSQMDKNCFLTLIFNLLLLLLLTFPIRGIN